MADKISNRVSLAILGASGYTGAESLRLLAHHPNVAIRAVTADRQAGRQVAEIFPHLAPLALPTLSKIAELDWTGIDMAFCCLPHATTQEVVSTIPARVKVVDLSADFRLADAAVYAEWYGHEHRALKLQRDAVYGLTEFHRDRIKPARLVANPGCYPSTAQLPLVPLLEAGAIDPDSIIIDAKSGVTGAGRSLREDLLFAEVQDGIHAYGVAKHRHMPEIDQGLSWAAGRPVVATFTPHLMPMNRGILATIYVRLAGGAAAGDIRATLAKRFEGEAFVKVLALGAVPSTRHVRGSNYCFIGVVADRRPGHAIIVAVMDNLVKGAAGQAVQNLNVMLGLPETTALRQEPMFP
ncbi:MAG: N-acetyl-gamma-glutamyl-phosphate reductase [Alphaproteobacteria bacterium]|nr:N-acetyl-gamma-glutamyl-phosphate reductase [Alphaproteobacteria bacterium]